jgi:hypothetical protein
MANQIHKIKQNHRFQFKSRLYETISAGIHKFVIFVMAFKCNSIEET